jgi:hypothetical protein
VTSNIIATIQGLDTGLLDPVPAGDRGPLIDARRILGLPCVSCGMPSAFAYVWDILMGTFWIDLCPHCSRELISSMSLYPEW